MKEATKEVKKSVEQAIEDGHLILLDKKLTKELDIICPVAMPADNYVTLDMAGKHRKKGQKAYKTLLNAVRWTIFKAQRTGIKSSETCRLDAAGFPVLALMVRPFSAKDLKSVIIVGVADIVKKEGADEKKEKKAA